MAIDEYLDRGNSGWSCDENGIFAYDKDGVRAFFDLNPTEGVRKEPSPVVSQQDSDAKPSKIKVRYKIDARGIQMATHSTRGRHRRLPPNDWTLSWAWMCFALVVQTISGLVVDQHWYEERMPLNGVLAIAGIVVAIYIFGSWARPNSSAPAVRRIAVAAIASLVIAAFFILM